MKGLVKVERLDIQNAIKSFEIKKSKLYSIMSKCKKELSEEYDKLSWWSKLWNEDEYTPKWKVVAKSKKLRGIYKILWTDWFDVFYKAGMISEDEYGELRITKYWDSHHEDVVNEVREMSKAGSEIYLTPKQAEFVNDHK